MSAQPIHQQQRPAKTPAGIRASLPPEELSRFETDFQARMREAAASYDLTPVHDCLDRWWPIAVSYSADPAAHHAMRAVASTLLLGEDVPGKTWAEMVETHGLPDLPH